MLNNQEYITTQLEKVLYEILPITSKRLKNLVYIIIGIILSKSVELSDISSLYFFIILSCFASILHTMCGECVAIINWLFCPTFSYNFIILLCHCGCSDISGSSINIIDSPQLSLN